MASCIELDVMLVCVCVVAFVTKSPRHFFAVEIAKGLCHKFKKYSVRGSHKPHRCMRILTCPLYQLLPYYLCCTLH